MPFVLIIIGLLFLISAVRGTQDYLAALIRSEFIGQGSFTYWVVVIILVGAIGYVDKFKKVSTGLLALILISLFLTRSSPSAPGCSVLPKFLQDLGFTQKVPSSTVSPSNFTGVTIGGPGTGPGVTIGIGPQTPYPYPGPTTGPVGGGPVIFPTPGPVRTPVGLPVLEE